MTTPSAGDLRNFAIVGHASSGKTMLSEAMLACAGVIGRMGNIAQGTTVSDFHANFAAALHVAGKETERPRHARLSRLHERSARGSPRSGFRARGGACAT